MSEEENQELIPVEQQTILFSYQELIVVRLPDGRAGIVLGFICRNLGIDTTAQLKRIQRTEAIIDDLVFTRITTPGGQQRMAILVLLAVPFWLASIQNEYEKTSGQQSYAIIVKSLMYSMPGHRHPRRLQF